MASWIRGMAVVLMVQGGLSLLVGLALMTSVFTRDPTSPSSGGAGTVGVLGLWVVLIGAFRIWAGIRNRQYRGRTLGIVAHLSSVLDLTAWSCLALYLPLSILGLVVYLGAEGSKAFEWGEKGCSVAEVQNALRALPAHPGEGEGRKRMSPLLLTLLIGIPLMVPLVGVMAALGIYGVRKYIANAKLAEASIVSKQLAGGIARCASERGQLPPSSAPVPASFASVKGRRYQSSPNDWSDEAFVCAGFSLSQPQYFQYRWVKQGDTGGVVTSQADLDGDGNPDIEHSVSVVCTGGICTVEEAPPGTTEI